MEVVLSEVDIGGMKVGGGCYCRLCLNKNNLQLNLPPISLLRLLHYVH